MHNKTWNCLDQRHAILMNLVVLTRGFGFWIKSPAPHFGVDDIFILERDEIVLIINELSTPGYTRVLTKHGLAWINVYPR